MYELYCFLSHAYMFWSSILTIIKAYILSVHLLVLHTQKKFVEVLQFDSKD